MSSSLRTSPDHGSVARALPTQPSRGAGHDERGRFTPGNHCGQGNPAAQQTAALRQALRAAISPEDITAIAEVLRELALGGNLAAIRLLLSYVLGRPGAADRDDTDQALPPPDTPALPPEPATVVVPPPDAGADQPAPAVSPREDAPSVYSPAPGPESPAPQAPRPPSATVVNGPPTPLPPSPTVDISPGTRPPPSPAADNGERPPTWAIRRWPR